MEQLDGAFRALHEGVVNEFTGEYGSHRDTAVREPLGRGDEIGHHVEFLRAERRAQAPEAGDDLIEDEENAVLVADFTQSLEVTQRRKDHSSGP